MTIGGKIRDVRRRNQLSQEEFALKIGVSRSVLSQIEIDKIRPSTETIKRISGLFNVDSDYLSLADELPQGGRTKPYTSYAYNREHWSDAENLSTRNPLPNSPQLAFRYEQPDYRREGLREIPYLRLVDRKRFGGISSLIDAAPHLSRIMLPVTTSGTLMAFEIPRERSSQNEILVCELSDRESLMTGDPIVIKTEKTILHGTVERTDSKRIFLGGESIYHTEITEIWRPLLRITSIFEDNTMNRRIARLELQVSELQRKK